MNAALKNHDLIVFLMGPTAVGKTSLAIELTEQFPVEIISVDSTMVYRGLDIGTGKPDHAILQAVKHHLIDILDAKESYSVAQFLQDAHKLIVDIQARNKIPLFVGGTMMYFHALQFGLSELPSSDSQIRMQLNNEMQSLGSMALHERLQTIDPIAAAHIHPNDPRRILRALEVYEITGIPMSTLKQGSQFSQPSSNILSLALLPTDRSELHLAIENRFAAMLDKGFVQEVERLYQRGDLAADLPAIRSVGYRQIWQYLDGQEELSRACEKAVFATRQLAKRQLTWLRHWPGLTNCYHKSEIVDVFRAL